MKGQTEIKSAQHLKRLLSFRIFSHCVGQTCAWSQLTEIDSDSAKKTGADSDSVSSRALPCGIDSDCDSG